MPAHPAVIVFVSNSSAALARGWSGYGAGRD
jgi:hypothetical protein